MGRLKKMIKSIVQFKSRQFQKNKNKKCILKLGRPEKAAKKLFFKFSSSRYNILKGRIKRK
jgi:hypothetical protein